MQAIIKLVPPKIIPYLKLMRLHSPVGALLTMWPGLWSLVLASDTIPSPWLLFVFILGSFLMRGAGCVINDIADRNIDPFVERTKNRPIANKEISIKQALIFLGFVLALCLGLLLTLNKLTIIIGLCSIIPVIIYPFMKRITNWPQIFLGITFNMGALMGWSAVRGTIEIPAVAIYIGSIFWTIGYDTIYAHQDKIDDKKIGVKSTALTMGKTTKEWLAFFYRTAAIFIVGAAILCRVNVNLYLLVVLPFYHLYWQVDKVDLDNPSDCFNKFKSNAFFGLLIFIALLISVVAKGL